MRYTYLGDKMTAPELRGMQCDPVRNAQGKCVCGSMGTMMVVNAAGVKHIVLRRRLRVNKEAKG